MNKQLELFQDAKENWESKITSSKDREYDFETVSGEKVNLLYHPSFDENNYLDNLGFPGQFPYTRGIHPNLYRGKLWTMRQFSGFGTPEETNEKGKLLAPYLVLNNSPKWSCSPFSM